MNNDSNNCAVKDPSQISASPTYSLSVPSALCTVKEIAKVLSDGEISSWQGHQFGEGRNCCEPLWAKSDPKTTPKRVRRNK